MYEASLYFVTGFTTVSSQWVNMRPLFLSRGPCFQGNDIVGLGFMCYLCRRDVNVTVYLYELKVMLTEQLLLFQFRMF